MSQTVPQPGRDERSGRFEAEFTDEEFIQTLDELDGAPTSEVAQEIGCKRNTAYKRLRRLRDEGRVESEEIGSSLRWTTADTDIRTSILSEMRGAAGAMHEDKLVNALDSYHDDDIIDELYTMEDDGIVNSVVGSSGTIWEIIGD